MSDQRYDVAVREVSHTFVSDSGRKIEALKSVSFQVNRGEFFVILGPSGCGKSTLLRLFAGMMPLQKGAITFADETVRTRTAMIFQSFALFPWLTVYENVAFGLRMRGVSPAEEKAKVHEHLAEMGLTGFAELYPKDLSGGMKQRVGIARALATNPQMLLMDEPFSALDAFTAKKLRAELLSLWEKDKTTVVMVTHLVDEAVEMADRVLVMTPLPGRVEAIMPVALSRPRNTRSSEFFSLVDKITEVVNV